MRYTCCCLYACCCHAIHDVHECQAVLQGVTSYLEQEEAEKRQSRAGRFNTEGSLVSGGAQLSTITNYLGTARGNQPEAMMLSDEGKPASLEHKHLLCLSDATELTLLCVHISGAQLHCAQRASSTCSWQHVLLTTR